MDIVIYTFCVMYSPGPVNLLALNEGLQGRRRSVVGYCVGVGLAMFSVFLVLGYLGAAMIKHAVMPYVAVAGSVYITYLAYRLFRSGSTLAEITQPYDDTQPHLRFRQGYLLQLLNPKGLIVCLPVTTVMFPSHHIAGVSIVVAASLISLGAMGAPLSYAWLGAVAGRHIANPRLMKLFNQAMAILLIGVAGSIVYHLLYTTQAG